ncbi:MAG: helix-turn-helix domain-containing protein [Acidobacteriota bacterium]
MIGEKLRGARQSQCRSLADVAGFAKVSVATLSRIENGKQSVDLGLFLILAKILQVPPHELLAEDSGASKVDPMARRIAGLGATDRTDFWRDLAAERRTQRNRRGAASRDLGQQVEELLAQVDFLREELESVRKRMKRRS